MKSFFSRLDILTIEPSGILSEINNNVNCHRFIVHGPIITWALKMKIIRWPQDLTYTIEHQLSMIIFILQLHNFGMYMYPKHEANISNTTPKYFDLIYILIFDIDRWPRHWHITYITKHMWVKQEEHLQFLSVIHVVQNIWQLLTLTIWPSNMKDNHDMSQRNNSNFVTFMQILAFWLAKKGCSFLDESHLLNPILQFKEGTNCRFYWTTFFLLTYFT